MQEIDNRLHRECLQGDPKAHRALYERFKVDMFRICLRYAQNREEAEDFLQEGFITVFKDLAQFRGEGPLGGWIRMVMVRTALQHIRKRKMLFSEIVDGTPGLSSQDHFDVHTRIDAEHLTSILQQMPAGYRSVFNLFAVEGYSHEEIASLFGISTSTSKTQLFKARQWLQVRLPAGMAKYI